MTLCALEGLRSSQNQEVLLHVDLSSHHSISVKHEELACCHGIGVRKSKEDSETFRTCPLKKRLAKVQVILDCYELTWKESFYSQALSDEEFRKYWQWFIFYKHRRFLKGNYTKDEKKRKAWTLALMGVWRLGLDCFIYNLKKHPISNFLLYIQNFKEEDSSPIIFLEVEDGVLSLQKREELAYIISWSEKHLSPLWIINLETPGVKNSKRTRDNVMKQFTNRIDRTKKRCFTENLEADSLSKLSTLCRDFPITYKDS